MADSADDPLPDDLMEVEIAAIGGGGDGIAETPRGRVFVPFAAPGDRLLVRLHSRPHSRSGRRSGRRQRNLRAAIVERIEDSPLRRPAPCRHFGDCGGCALQHLKDGAYVSWKTGRVRDALARHGLDAGVVGELQGIPAASRRRVGLKAHAAGGRVLLGFFAAASHHVADMAECTVIAPEIFALLGPLRGLFGEMLAPGENAEAAATLVDSGLDVVLRLPREPDLAGLEALAGFADDADLARLGWQALQGGGEDYQPVAARRPVQASFSGVTVDLPPDGFVQPSRAGEDMLTDAVRAGLAGAGLAADLYAGCGAFSFALAASGTRVRAFEAAGDHRQALQTAARRAGLGTEIEVETRDLVRRPLGPDELAPLDAVVLDPPRPGAAPQAAMLAASKVPHIAYVSCNPVSFARDAETLVNGGYALESVMPLDQFPFTPHVELVALFRKGGG